MVMVVEGGLATFMGVQLKGEISRLGADNDIDRTERKDLLPTKTVR